MMRGRSTKQKRSAARCRDIETMLRCAVTPVQRRAVHVFLEFMYILRVPAFRAFLTDSAIKLRRGEERYPNPAAAEVFGPYAVPTREES